MLTSSAIGIAHFGFLLQAGVIGYLAKPFSEDDLLACIRSNLGRPEAGGEGA